MHRHQIGAHPARRARRSPSTWLRPGLTKGILAALTIEAAAVGLGVSVTLLLLRWA